MKPLLHTYREHEKREFISTSLPFSEGSRVRKFRKIRKGQDVSLPCYSIERTESNFLISTNYFIGIDWLQVEQAAICVSPKLNNETNETDYIKMLFSCLKHPEVASEINELFEVDWKSPTIAIEQKQDLLTPFLIVEFLSLLKTIVRKGLKKSYYKIERNLHSRVKGKIMVGKTIKQNILQNKKVNTFCSYEEYGLNHSENRLLKKALVFIRRYLPTYPQLTDHKDLIDTFNYINPGFESISDQIELSEIKTVKANSFYKEYPTALNLAKLILRRFGYNISNTNHQLVKTPPFWIDMSKLFELYTLGLLRDRFHKQVKYQFKSKGNELDFLINSPDFKMVVDTKYKLKYLSGVVTEDIRQVSGYARLKRVYEQLSIEKGKVIDCLIIHPDQTNGIEDFSDIEKKIKELKDYNDVYQVGIKLPMIN